MAVTIKDVAQRCGMSISTVSKVFNGYSDISEETRNQVRRAAQEIGYHPNALARALQTNRSYNLGVLFVDESNSGLTHPFFAAVLNAFKQEAEARGYDITFINHNNGASAMTYLEHCTYRNVDGVCMACINFYSEEVRMLAGSGIPCVSIDHRFEGQPSVYSDNAAGIRLLVERAYALGHRRIVYLHGQRNSEVTEIRTRSFAESMRALGLPLDSRSLVESRYDDSAFVMEQLRALLSAPDRPTCILLPDDISYVGAQSAAMSLGLRMPDDISFAGFDGIRLTQTLRPYLTTVRQDSVELGRQAALRLIEAVEHPGAAPLETTLIPVTLLEGETLGKNPQ